MDGSESKLRRRHSDKESSITASTGGKEKEVNVGQKLIEVEKSETGSVSFKFVIKLHYKCYTSILFSGEMGSVCPLPHVNWNFVDRGHSASECLVPSVLHWYQCVALCLVQ